MVEAYLAAPQYAPGGDGSLIESEENAKASDRLNTALVGKLRGDAQAMFQNTGTTYHKKGFTKVARLKEAFADESALALAREVFGFFKGLDQNDTSPIVYERDLRYAFDRFTLAGCPLPEVLQVMFQVRGLNPKYAKLEESLKDGTRKW